MAISTASWSYTWGTAYVNLWTTYVSQDDNYVYYDLSANCDTVNNYRYGYRLWLEELNVVGITRLWQTTTGYRYWDAGVVATLGSFRRAYPKQNSAYTVTVKATAAGETVNGIGGYWGSAATSQYLTIPAKLEAATPPAPTVTGTGNTRTVTCPAVTNGRTYTLYLTYGAGVWVSLGNVTAGVAKEVTLNPNSAAYFRYTATGPNGVVKTGAASAVAYTTPPAPSGLTAAAQQTEVALAWSVNSTYSTGIVIQRSSTSAFTNPVTIYTGASKSYHVDIPPAGANYYRVCNTGPTPYGQTAWSNIASAQTMVAPAPPSNFKRGATVDSNTVTISWTNNATELAPYSTVRVETSTDFLTWSSFNIYGGTTTTFSHELSSNEKRYYRARAENAVGASEWETFGPFYTRLPDMKETLETRKIYAFDRKLFVSVGWEFEALPIDTHEDNVYYEIQVQDSTDNETWSAWRSAGSASYTTSSTNVGSWVTRAFVRVRIRAHLDNVWDGNRVSEWFESEVFVLEKKPPAPVISYDKDTLTLSVKIEADEWAHIQNSTLKYYRDDAVVREDYFLNGNAVNASYHWAPKGPKIKIQLAMSSPWWAEGDLSWSNIIEVDFDGVQVIIDGYRYAAYLLYENQSAIPCGVNLV